MFSRIMRGLNVPSTRGPGLRYRDWYIPQPASSRRRLVTGDDHVAVLMCEGWKSVYVAASGVVVPVPPPFTELVVYCSDQWADTLLRGEICHVMRPIPLRSRLSSKAGFVLPQS